MDCVYNGHNGVIGRHPSEVCATASADASCMLVCGPMWSVVGLHRDRFDPRFYVTHVQSFSRLHVPCAANRLNGAGYKTGATAIMPYDPAIRTTQQCELSNHSFQ